MHPDYQTRLDLIEHLLQADSRDLSGDLIFENRKQSTIFAHKALELLEGIAPIIDTLMPQVVSKMKRPSLQIRAVQYAMQQIWVACSMWTKKPDNDGITEKVGDDYLSDLWGGVRTMERVLGKQPQLVRLVNQLQRAWDSYVAAWQTTPEGEEDLVELSEGLPLPRPATDREHQYNALAEDVKESLENSPEDREDRAFFLQQMKKILFAPDESQMALFASLRVARAYKAKEAV